MVRDVNTTSNGHAKRLVTAFVALLAVLGMAFVVTSDPGDQSDASTSPVYTLTFLGNGGTAGEDTKRVYMGYDGQELYLPSTTFTKEGQYLDKWSCAEGDFEPGQKYTVTGDMTFTAQWKTGEGTYWAGGTQTVENGETYTASMKEDSFWNNYTNLTTKFPAGFSAEINYSDTLHTAGSIDITGAPHYGVHYLEMTYRWENVYTTNWWIVSVPSPMDTLYTVEFDTNGGEAKGDLSSQVTADGMIVTLPNADSVVWLGGGKTFVGWDIKTGPDTPTYPTSGSYQVRSADADDNGVIVAKAHWVDDPYVMVINPNGAPGIEAYIIWDGDTEELPDYDDVNTMETGDRKGYSFAGWYVNVVDDNYENSPVYAPGYMYTVDGGMEIVIYWIDDSAQTYELMYAGNGSPSNLTQKVEVGDKVVLPTSANFERPGYTFSGWNTKADGTGAHYDAGEEYTPSADVTLYAQWDSNVQPVESITINGPSVVRVGETIDLTAVATPDDADKRIRFTIESDDTQFLQIISQTPSSTAASTCRLMGISEGSVVVTATALDGSGVTQTKTITIEPGTSDATITLVYDPNGGTGGPGMDSVVSVSGTHTFTILPDKPTKEGFVFKGWSNTQGGGVDYEAGDTIEVTSATPKTIWAVWEEAATSGYFRLSYDANGGVGAPDSVFIYDDGESYTFTISTSQMPARLGYTFLGYSLDPNDTEAELQPGSPLTVTKSETTVYAIWTPTKSNFVLKYDANGGSGGPETYKETTASTYISFVPSFTPQPTRDGYSFIGWAFDKNATAANLDFPLGSSKRIEMSVSDRGQSCEKTIYAVWQQGQNTVTLSFDDNSDEDGAVTGMPSEIVIKNSVSSTFTFTIPEDIPVWDGHEFLGWSTNAEDQKPTYTYDGADSTKKEIEVKTQQTLYAIWAEVGNDFELVYNANAPEGETVSNVPFAVHRTSSGDTYDFTTDLQSPTCSGNWICLGWSLDPEADAAEFGFGVTVPGCEPGTTNLYAVWKQSAIPFFVVSFDTQGGVPEVPTQDVVAGGYAKLPETAPTKEGYSFAGWFTAKEGGERFDFANTPITAKTTIYAQWTPDGTTPGGDDDDKDDDDKHGEEDGNEAAYLAVGAVLIIGAVACALLLPTRFGVPGYIVAIVVAVCGVALIVLKGGLI